MKRNFLRLCLTMAVVLSTYSCRQDLLPEKETYHNTSAFRLTSKRISLDEAKHKEKLLPELQKAKKEVEKQKLNIQGKLVNVGNGIVIDTDEVIYMENGPDFHTYTFSVVRENSQANAPVENILMTPQTDGSYRVFHIVLNLSEADKTKIANKEFVNFKNKSQITELGSMNLSSLAQRSNCTPEYYSYPIPCSDANYRHLPGESCQLSGTSGEAYWATGVFWNCQNIPEPVDNVITPSEGGSGGGGSTDPATPPDDCITTVTNPGEVGIINESGCNTIVPTEPYLPNLSDNPCRKTNASITAANNVLHDTNISAEVASLEGHAANSFTEYGMAIINTGTITIAQDPYTNNDPNNPGTVSITIPPVGSYLASAHSHPSHGAAPPSVADFYADLKDSKKYPSFQAGFVFANNGTKYAFVVNDRAKVEAFLTAYPFVSNTTPDGRMFNENSQVGKDFIEILENYTEGRLPNYSGIDQNDGLESAYAEILQKYDTGISLAKTDDSGNLKSLRSVSFDYTIPASGGKKIRGYRAEKCP